MARGSVKVPLLVSGGVREDVNPAAVPPGNLLASENVLVRHGQLKTRHGYGLIGQVAAADRVLGFGFRGSPLLGTNVVVHTKTAAYLYDGSSFSAITGTWTASSDTQLVRFATWRQSGTTYVIRVNEANAPDSYSGTGNFTDVSGSPPSSARDILVAGNRVVLIKAGGAPYRVQWSGFNDMGSWGVNDFADLQETPGLVVAGRALGPNSFAVWKEDALYVAQLQAALTPFNFQFIARVPGPASAAAIAEQNGKYYWLAEDGNIYVFDGSSKPQAIGMPVVGTLKSTFSVANAGSTFGFSISTHDPEVWFCYPQAGASNVVNAISLHTELGAYFPHEFTDTLTAAAEWISASSTSIDGLSSYSSTIDGLSSVFTTIDGMSGTSTRVCLLGDNSGNVYRFGAIYTDNGDEIPWTFTHGYKAPADAGNRFYLDGITSYWEELAESVVVTVSIVVTDDLGDDETASTDTFDLADSGNHLVTFPNVRGQWIKVTHSGTKSRSQIEHRGAAILAWPRKMF